MRKRCWNHCILELLVNPKNVSRNSSENQGVVVFSRLEFRSAKSLDKSKEAKTKQKSLRQSGTAAGYKCSAMNVER